MNITTTTTTTTIISFVSPCLAVRRRSRTPARRRRMRVVRARARSRRATTMTVARASDRRPLGARRARVHVRGRNNPRQIPHAIARAHVTPRRRRRNVKQSIARRRSPRNAARARVAWNNNHHETSPRLDSRSGPQDWPSGVSLERYDAMQKSPRRRRASERYFPRLRRRRVDHRRRRSEKVNRRLWACARDATRCIAHVIIYYDRDAPITGREVRVQVWVYGSRMVSRPPLLDIYG